MPQTNDTRGKVQVFNTLYSSLFRPHPAPQTSTFSSPRSSHLHSMHRVPQRQPIHPRGQRFPSRGPRKRLPRPQNRRSRRHSRRCVRRPSRRRRFWLARCAATSLFGFRRRLLASRPRFWLALLARRRRPSPWGVSPWRGPGFRGPESSPQTTA